jgi:hypothetical protein
MHFYNTYDREDPENSEPYPPPAPPATGTTNWHYRPLCPDTRIAPVPLSLPRLSAIILY